MEAFSNNSYKNYNNLNYTNFSESDKNQKPGQNIYIPDFIVKNSTLYANGLLDINAKNINFSNLNESNMNHSNSNISDLIVDNTRNSISPVKYY